MYNPLRPIGITVPHNVYCERCSVRMQEVTKDTFSCPSCGEEIESPDERRIVGEEEYVQ